MTRDLKIHVDGCSLWWNEKSSQVARLKELKSDSDVILMASSVGQNRIASVYVKVVTMDDPIGPNNLGSVASVGNSVKAAEANVEDGLDEVEEELIDAGDEDLDGGEEHVYSKSLQDDELQEEAGDEDLDAAEEHLGSESGQGRDPEDHVVNKGVQDNEGQEAEGDGQESDAESDIHDSEYSLNSEGSEGSEGSDEAEGDEGDERNSAANQGYDAHVNVGQVVDDDEQDVQTDYADSDELQSCSSTDEEGIKIPKPKYSEFREQADMKDPQFKIGMKFRSFA
ncbi:sarcoplasmic reticulum histidine-rich calcium-binding protein-like [Dioscorea cayenensis subsp. rotundata]|uniref:Sarcoplasmic reticulum histidine-rich calcium-binding protein-like n=1 Tax=Dioscorea cayennensis subsp. rotundata TaxID=55577 RepID=A0AB40CG07_DIOCR|nr:sarcoplasmic reticulum histidine-rich calcium-binding protein-like [Dioscorea cayenensis subsp. rotundata]